jgi:hypothetical protein
MTPMPVSTFTRSFLLLFCGPIVWAVHFLAIYGFTGVMCARPRWQQMEWLGYAIVRWGVVAAGLLAAAGIAAFLVQARRPELLAAGIPARMASGLGWLALLAIAWETAAAFVVPACLPVT